MPKSAVEKKSRVYEVAKDLGMSSEAVLQIVRKLGVEVKNHMSTLATDTVEKIRAEIAQGTAAVKEEQARKHEHELQRAREERARQAAAQAAAQTAAQQASAPTAPPAPGAPAAPARPVSPGAPVRPVARPGIAPSSRPSGPAGGGPRIGGAPSPGFGSGRPSFGGPGRGGPGGGRRRDRKKKKVVDEKLVQESLRKTLASLDTGTARRKHRRRDEDGTEIATEDAKVLRTTEFVTVAELANQLEVKPQEVITTCMRLGLMATINKRLDKDSIMAVADEFGYTVEFVTEFEEPEIEETEGTGHQLPRAPVVTVMGHVDHGKTSLLDYIRRTNVVAGESGGITQHIGAYDVATPDGRKICFLDTPGHEAFTAMRARGAQVTDIVVLVVAADDRVMPQTVEAIDHAKAANVPIVVAINKIDLPGARPDLVKQELASRGVVVEEYGGKVVCAEISAKKGTNVDKLLSLILLQADLLELTADPERRAKGVVLESRVEQGRGIVASLLVQLGTLHVGDAFVAGQHSGRVRAMYDERGRAVREAGPSTPVEVVGWSGTPAAGDMFNAFEDEREAREIAAKRQAVAREQEFRAAKAISLTEIYSQISQGEVNELKMVIKGDVDGSVEALSESFTKLTTSEVKVHVIRQAVGQITESDVLLAAASGAIIVGFHVRPDSRVRELAQREKVEIRLYDIIYKAVEDVKAALEGMLKPEEREVVLGSAEVRDVFKLSKAGTVAGCMVTSGTIPRTGSVRLLRDGVPIWTGRIGSLRRFKDDVREVQSGFECGIGLDGMNDVKVGDVIESFKIESIARTLA
ncbi:MAG: translation initiation factor IF-2 [Candidatus Eisenbacteria bacterium]